MPETVSPPKPKAPKPTVQPPLPKSNAPDPRQTLSYLRGLMENFRLEPKSKLGQNFLIDLNLVDLIVRAGDLTSADSVLEVGTGTGSLTNKIADWAACVFTVEVDKSFHRMAQTFIGHRLNVVSHLGDALERKNELNPDMLAGWAELTAKFHAKKLKLIANLPYAVATPIITNLLLLPELPIDRMVVMVQWEIAERLRDTKWAHTVAFVPYMALSGAAIMALGCDEIVMDAHAKLGDAGPIFLNEGAIFEHAPEKIRTHPQLFPVSLTFTSFRNGSRQNYPCSECTSNH